MATKAVRFSKEDDELIKEFLEKNPIFDFSMLARTAILNFIKNPEIKILPVDKFADSSINRIGNK